MSKLERQDVAAPAIDLEQASFRPAASRVIPMRPPHERAQRLDQVDKVDPSLALRAGRRGDRWHFQTERLGPGQLGDDIFGNARTVDQALEAGCWKPVDWHHGSPELVTSPAAHRPGRVVCPCESTVTPPIM